MIVFESDLNLNLNLNPLLNLSTAKKSGLFPPKQNNIERAMLPLSLYRFINEFSLKEWLCQATLLKIRRYSGTLKLKCQLGRLALQRLVCL